MNSDALAGVAVLDLSVWRPGPYATQLLAELGADVLKVEPPGGDPMRIYAGLFETLHAGKRSLEIDLKQPEGHGRVMKLCTAADVVVEGWRPGVAERLGVGYGEVSARNPSVVYCSVSGYGQTGALHAHPGHDVNYQAWSGSLCPDGGVPVTTAVPVADLAGGMAAALAICAALVRRNRTGAGEHLDVAMTDVLATWTGPVGAQAGAPAGDERPQVPGYGVFPTADGGHVALGVLSEDHFWTPLCRVLGLEEVAALGFAERSARVTELQSRLRTAIAGWERDVLVDALTAQAVPVAPVLDREGMLASAALRERGTVVIESDGAARLTHPVRFREAVAALLGPAPRLDQNRGEGFAS